MKINLLNYESFAVDYLEGNLSPEDIIAMQHFLMAHPKIKQELEDMAEFELPALASFNYPEKSDLFRKSRKMVIPILAAAASLFLLISLGYTWLFNASPDVPLTAQSQMTVTKDQQASNLSTIESEQQIRQAMNQLIEDSLATELNMDDSEKPKELQRGMARIDKQIDISEQLAQFEPEKVKSDNIENEMQSSENNELIIVETISPGNDTRFKKETIVTRLPRSTMQPVVTQRSLEPVVLVVYDLEDFSKSKVALSKRLGFLADLMQPESFENEEAASIKDVFVPEAFGNIFTKKTR